MPATLQHGDEQRGLVFAVAVAIAEDVGGMVGLQPPMPRSTMK